jgi:L-rhamnose mutarotase
MTTFSPSSNNLLLLVTGTAVTASLATLAVQRLLQSRRRAPKRCAGAIKLKPEQFDLYTQLHDSPWEEVLDRMYQSNIRNFTIYYHNETCTMFHHFDWIGGIHLDPVQDKAQLDMLFEKDMNAIAADPATREWWGYCEPCQTPFSQWPADLKPHSQQQSADKSPQGDWWAPLTCLNHCGYWPVAYSTMKRDPFFVPQNPTKRTCSRANPPY